MIVKSGQAIENRKTGERLTMITSEADTGGAFQLYRVDLPPLRPGPPLHYHVAFAETFTVLEGTLDIYLGRERRHLRLKSGESILAEAGQLHTFENHSDLPCRMTVETRPAGGVVRAFQLAYGIANDGGAAKDGLPKNPLIRLRFIQISQGFIPGPPRAFQKALFTAAELLSRITGVERRLQRYLSD